MEELWKKYKQETQEHLEKINEFLNEISSNEKSNTTETEKPFEILKNETSEIPQQTVWKEASKIPKQVVLEENDKSQLIIENETSQKKKHATRKKIYGKLRDVVKEIMEKENVSRAQAYRRAKKRFLKNNS